MGVDTTTIGERGQIVIPQSVRMHQGIRKGDTFMVLEKGDLVVLKRLKEPTAGELDKLLKSTRQHATENGLTESDLKEAIRKAREKG
ncbi:MAG: AbrB/MazE/SpoVT family DNA-binding domain-containing protein [archaeon]